MKKYSIERPAHRFKVLCYFILALTLSCNKDDETKNNVIDDSANYTVTTFAGNGTNGNDPVTGGLALLWFPGDVVFDAQGNLFVADGYNDEIKRVSPAGIMTSFAGSDSGYADGNGSDAKFDRPFKLTIDAQGNLFVAESGARIRKITPDGVVTTIAGNGIKGLVDGIGTEAQIDLPRGIAIDPQGTIYFTQDGFHGIRQISTAGAVSTFVGSSTPGFAEGEGITARFNEPYGLVCDAQGNLYVTDRNNARIRKVSSSGVVTTLLKRNMPEEIGNFTRDAQGNFYITQGDLNKTEVIKYDVQGRLTKIAGGQIGYLDGPGNVAQFTYASGLTTDAAGTLYFSDFMNNMIRKIKRN